MKKYITAILSIGTVAMLFYTLFDLKNQVKQIPVLQHQLDSLNLELHIATTNLGRHELAVEEIIKPKKEIYEKYQTYILEETE
jgi:hypothetical protein